MFCRLNRLEKGDNLMSLTTIITEPEVRVQLKKLIRRPDFDGERKLLAPSLTKNYMLVGTAFDYILRFYLKRVNPQAVERGHWVAETAAFQTDAGILDAASGRIEIMPELATSPDKHKLAVQMKRTIDEAKYQLRLCLKTGRITDRLLSSAIQLAKLDGIFRGGLTGQVDLADIDERDKDDLRQLVRVIPAIDFKAKTICVLNPTFGEASGLVGGADADVIIDDTLIEIKTVMKCRLLSNYLHQLAGYYCLYRIGGVNGVPTDKPLRKIGVYFSRHGYLYSVPMTECWLAKDFKAFIKWFEHFIRARA